MKTFDQLIITTGFFGVCLSLRWQTKSRKRTLDARTSFSSFPTIIPRRRGGIYGGILSEYVKNENIRRLAAEGCVLDNCFCTNSISVPSRAAIMTGAYSHHNGVYTLEDRLDPALDNIAKRMQEGGYQTALSANGISRRSRRVSTPFRFSMTRGNIGTRFSRPRRAG